MDMSQTDTVLLAIPFVSLLAAFVFRLDVIIFKSNAKKPDSSRPRFANFDADGMAMADPDGQIALPVRGRMKSSLDGPGVRPSNSMRPL